MKKAILLFFCIILLEGCTALRPTYNWENAELLEPIILPSFSSNYLLSCLNDMQGVKQEEFAAKYKSAEESLEHGRNLDKLRFICLSLNEKADYKQFKQGKTVLEEYLEGNHSTGDDMRGFQVLVNRLDEEILNRWSAWKSLLNDKTELNAEVESLQIKIEAQQKQIEQLKNIENIIKSRGSSQP